MTEKIRILIAGIGGASLGTEILKCLRLLPDKYEIFGTDISPTAYGHFDAGFVRTFLINRDRYAESTIDLCKTNRIDCIIPGGEEPLYLLCALHEELETMGVRLAANDPTIIQLFSDKRATFLELQRKGFAVPETRECDRASELDGLNYPCVVKPSVGSGGSSHVFLAADKDETWLYVTYLKKMGKRPIIQEYIPETEGEFTIGVLSLPDETVFGSIALRRLLDSKLSVLHKSELGLVSSGYSQGLIQDYCGIRETAERIAQAFDSRGPLNIQGRVRNGEFVPFEINPRFSASTYLRALAGFNEIDVFISKLFGLQVESRPRIRYGYYLRTLCEVYAGEKVAGND